MKLTRKIVVFAGIITVMLTTVLSANVSAMTLIQPYGYSMPIETLAQNPSAQELTAESFIALGNHNVSLDGKDMVMTGNNSDGMSCISLGGKGYSGDELLVKPANGKQINKMVFSVSASNVYINNGGYTAERGDISGYAFINGKYTSVGMNFDYIWKPSENNKVQAAFVLPAGNSQSFSLNQGEMYTLITEFDVPNDIIKIRITDSHNQLIKSETRQNLGMKYVRNGYRFRASNILDVRVREMSTMRETFIIKNETFTNADSISASVSVASDCTERAAYGTLIKNSPKIILGQFDSENRMLNYESKSINITGASKDDTEPKFETISVSVPKKAEYDHAYACIWTNDTDMIPYRNILAD